MSQHISLPYAPVKGCFTAPLLSHRKMLLLHFRLTMIRPLRNQVPLHTTTFILNILRHAKYTVDGK
jgi:hypothetical protein